MAFQSVSWKACFVLPPDHDTSSACPCAHEGTHALSPFEHTSRAHKNSLSLVMSFKSVILGSTVKTGMSQIYRNTEQPHDGAAGKVLWDAACQ